MIRYILNSLFISVFLLSGTIVLGEGTKQLNPSFGDRGAIQIYHRNQGEFSTYRSGDEDKIFVTACEPNEIVHIGMQSTRSDLVFRVIAPDGSVALTERDVPESGDEGYIDSYAEAVAGPVEMVAGGYDAISFVATQTGDYKIEFDHPTGNNNSPGQRDLTYFDVTVEGTDGSVKTGRLWSKRWLITCTSFNDQFRGEMFMYSDDGIVTQLKFNGIQPWRFQIFANQYGPNKSTPSDITDRYSVQGLSGDPQYKIFFDDPDTVCFPSGTYGDIVGDVTITGCDPDSLCINFEVTQAGFVSLLLDLNGVDGYQSGTEDIVVWNDSISQGVNCIPWNSLNGLGDYVEPGQSIPIQLDYSNGITHLPLYDVETHNGGYIVELIRPNNGIRPQLFWNDTPVGGGVEETGCDDVNGCHTWGWFGGDRRTMNTFWYANIIKNVAEYANDNVISVDANTFKPDGASADANDTTFCGSETRVEMGGEVTNSPGATWETVNGFGSFDDPSDLNTFYNIHPDDVAAGEISIILIPDDNSICSGTPDTMRMKFQDLPVLSVGTTTPACSNNPTVSLSTASNAYWVGNGGSFTPDSLSSNPSYTPSQAEIDAGSTFVRIFSIDNGICSASEDTVAITINTEPVAATIGTVDSVCANNSTFTLNGAVSNATGGTWSGGIGTYVSGANSLITDYIPHASELSNGEVTFTLTTSGEETSCLSEDISHTVYFSDSPVVEAGAPIETCENNISITLNGTVTNAGGGVWSGNGGSFDLDSTTLTGIEYTPTQSEIDARSFYLTLTATDFGDCSSVSDSVLVTILDAPTVAGGGDALSCANDPTVALNGSFGNTTNVEWTGLGGTFSPSEFVEDPVYTISQAEIDLGITTLVLNSVNSNGCFDVSDTVIIRINPSPEAITPDTIWACENNPDVTLSGSFVNADGFYWTGGLGTYTPHQVDLNAVYTAHDDEIAAGKAVVTLNVVASECNDETSDITILFGQEPIVEAGTDIVSCQNNNTERLNGSVTKFVEGVAQNGEGQWSNYSGTLVGDSLYTPSQTELDAGFVDLVYTSINNGECNQVSDTLRITYGASPTVDAGERDTICYNNPVVFLNATTSTGSGAFVNGLGAFSADNTDITGTYTADQVELDAGTFELIVGSTNNGECVAEYDTLEVFVEPAPVVDPGVAPQVCEDGPTVSLSGTASNAGGGLWTGGFGSFTVDSNVVTTYNPTPTEITNGQVVLTLTSLDNGLCNAVSEDLTITIDPVPTVGAGSDQVLCGDVSSILFNGAVTNAGGGVWSHNGVGSFASDTSLNATYTIDPADLDDTLTFVLSTRDEGACQTYTDTVLVSFTDVPTITAGADQTVCTNDLPVQLAASGSAAQWTGGLGSFSPDDQTLNAQYTPHVSEEGNVVNLTVTTIVNGSCPAVSDQVAISIPEGPVVEAGTDQTVCADTAGVTLQGTLSNAIDGVWTTSGRGYFNGDSSYTNAIAYVLDNKDIEDGEVVLYLTNDDDGICSQESDSVVITVIQSPEVSSGPSQTYCGDVGTFALFGTLANATGVKWTTLGDGVFAPNDTTLLADYTPGTTDVSSGGVSLVVETTGNGLCHAVLDTVEYVLTPIPTINAVVIDSVCADVDTIYLSGSVTVATGGEWFTPNGQGNFSPTSMDTVVSYVPSDLDRDQDSLVFVFATTGVGLCNNYYDTLIVPITPAPIIDLGDELTVCADSTVDVSADLTVATAGYWSTNSDGSFADTNALSTVYTPSVNDIATGVTVLSFTSTSQGICKSTTESIRVNYLESPEIDAGGDLVVCDVDDSLVVVGTVQNINTFEWSTSGDGLFNSDMDTASVIYSPGGNDVTNGSVDLILSTVTDGTCAVERDTMTITINTSPEIDGGNDFAICNDTSGVEIISQVNNALGVKWNTLGTGQFYPNQYADTVNYVPSSTDLSDSLISIVLESTGNGPCATGFDTIQIAVLQIPEPVIDNGDEVICSNQDTLLISGNVNNATGGVWKTSSGSGEFTSDSTLNSAYVIHANDILAGDISLVFESYGNGVCTGVYSESISVSIDKLAEVNAGGALELCSTVDSIDINSVIDHAGGVEWSVSAGVFVPNNFADSPTYRPTTAVKNSGSIELTVVSQNNGVCPVISDTVAISFYQEPTIDAASDLTICETGDADLSGASQNVVDLQWTTSGSGAFFPSEFSEVATYQPSSQDISDSVVVLTISSLSNGPCPLISDSMTLYINPQPTITATSDAEVCGDIEEFNVSATMTNAGGVSWTTIDGAGTVVDSNLAITRYSLDSLDRSASSVSLLVTTTGNNMCAAATAVVTTSITTAPTLNAGPDKLMCDDATSVSLDGMSTGMVSVTWEAESGLGSFAPANAAQTIFSPDPSDLAKDSIQLKVIGVGDGSCGVLEKDLVVYLVDGFEIDAGDSVMQICTNDFPVELEGTGADGSWSGGLGVFSPNASVLNPEYEPHADEVTAGFVTLTLTSVSNATCSEVMDTIRLEFLDGPELNFDTTTITVCGDTAAIDLVATVNNAGGVEWSSLTDGDFVPSDTSLTTAYTLSADDITNTFTKIKATTTDNGLCSAVELTKEINILPIPLVDAGLAQSICADADTIKLSSSFENTTGITWSTLGTGSFVGGDVTNTNAQYLVSADDSSALGFELVVESDDDGLCQIKYDTLTITLTEAVTIDAGAQIDACEDEVLIQLDATVGVATGGSWSTTGGGTFTASRTTLDAVYSPVSSDISAGSIILYVASTGNGTCRSVSDSVELIFEERSEIQLSDSVIDICEVMDPLAINGAVSVTGKGTWSTTGTGTFTPDDTTLTTAYTPSQQDLNNGGVNIFLTSRDNAVCSPTVEVLSIDVTPSPVSSVNAGFDTEICADANSIQLVGQIIGAQGGQWSTTGNGQFLPNEFDLNAVYVLDPSDTVIGEIEIRLTSLENGICNPTIDTMFVTITPKPTIDLGDDFIQCKDNDQIVLLPNYTVAGGIEWSTNGNGSFEPNEFTDSISYRATQDDFERGVIGFTATTTSNGTCNAYSDNISVNFEEIPVVSTISDFTICANIDTVDVDGLVQIAGGSVWSSNTGGDFIDTTSLNTEYIINATDVSNGRAILQLTSTDNGTCNVVSDQLVIEIEDSPMFNIGTDIQICEDFETIDLNATIQNTDSVFWSVSGTGVFENADNKSLNTTYVLSSADKQQDSLVVSMSSYGDEFCAVESTSIIAFVEDAPTLSIQSNMVCTDLSEISLSSTVTEADGILWSASNGGVFSLSRVNASVTYAPSQADMSAGMVEVFAQTTGNGTCQPVVDSVEVVIKELPAVDAGANFIACNGVQEYITGSNDGSSSYQWLNLNGGLLGRGNVLNFTPSIDTVLVLNVIDVDGCVNYDSIEVVTITPPTFNLIPEVCYEEGFVLDADPQNIPSQGGTFQWYRDGVFLFGETDPNAHRVDAPGLHEMIYNVESCNASAIVEVHELPDLNGEDVIVCVGGSTMISIDNVGGTFSWTEDGQTIVSATDYELSVEGSSVVGDREYIATASDMNGCFNSDTIIVSSIEVPDIDVRDTSLCEGNPFILYGEPANVYDSVNSTYEWLYNGAFLTNVSSIYVNETGLYSLNYSIGECTVSIEADVSFNPLPVAQNKDEDHACFTDGETLVLDAGPASSFIWGVDSSTSQTLEVYSEGYYFFEIFNEFGCSVQDSIFALDECPPEVYVSTAFIPGSGGDDARWRVFGTDFELFSVTVYNRWGEVIFYSEDKEFEWDGTYRGQEVQSGVYPYVLRYKGTLEGYTDEKTLEGNVTIIK